MEAKQNPQTLRRVLGHVGRYRGWLVGSFLLCVVTVLCTLYVPVLIGNAIDKVIGPGQVDFAGLVPLLAHMGLLVAVAAVCQWLMGVCNNHITFGTVKDIRQAAFVHIQRLPLSVLDAHPTGDLVSRVIADVDQLADGLLMGFAQLFSGVLTVVGTLFFMFRVNGLLAGAVVVITPVSLLVASTIAKRSYALFARQSQWRGEQTALIDEMVAGQKTVRAFGREAAVQQRFDRINQRLAEASCKAIFISATSQPSTRFVNALVYACVGVVGAVVSIRTGGLTVGQLSAFLSYANQYTKPFNEISGVVTELQNALACAKRVFDIMDKPLEEPDSPGAVALAQVDGTVVLDRVAFSYEREKKLIENLSFTAAPGQRIAIVGPTGCGKTTLINLLMRFYDVDEGAILISGHEIRQVTRQSLRHAFGMVLQDTWLKAGTIRENIIMGKPEATDGEMIAAARATRAHSFIRRLPQGYDTLMDAEGGSLSQGQKQLLCITRVMLLSPGMLILDEATSSIDTRTEMEVQAAFEKLMKGKTSFIVAHRLSTIQTADVILVMNQGRIVEKGNHRQLVSQGGFYAQLYQSQFEA